MERSVAPLAGAWIEIDTKTLTGKGWMSLLSQERGLKSVQSWGGLRKNLSLLSQERGLKYHQQNILHH